jgi:hypothetical protein
VILVPFVSTAPLNGLPLSVHPHNELVAHEGITAWVLWVKSQKTPNYEELRY